MQARFAEKPRTYYAHNATQARGYDFSRSRSLSRTSSGAGGSLSSLWEAQETQGMPEGITNIQGFNRPQPPGKRLKFDPAAPLIVLSSSEDVSMSMGSETSLQRAHRLQDGGNTPGHAGGIKTPSRALSMSVDGSQASNKMSIDLYDPNNFLKEGIDFPPAAQAHAVTPLAPTSPPRDSCITGHTTPWSGTSPARIAAFAGTGRIWNMEAMVDIGNVVYNHLGIKLEPIHTKAGLLLQDLTEIIPPAEATTEAKFSSESYLSRVIYENFLAETVEQRIIAAPGMQWDRLAVWQANAALRLIGIQFQVLPEVDYNTGTQDTVLNIIYTEGVKGRAIAALRMAN